MMILGSIGKAIGQWFTTEGANVVITGRNIERLLTTKNEIETFEGQVLTFQMDVRVPENVERMVKENLFNSNRIWIHFEN